MTLAKQSYWVSRFVILLSVLIALCLGFAVWNINPWPTDAEVYYMPAALRIPYVHYLSEIHITEGLENIRWLHGKEFYVVAISFFQFLLNDFESLRPLMLVGLVAIAVSSILVFYVARRIWGQWIALWCYFAFTLSLWPYIYILFAKHQTLGLMLFLIAVFFLLNAVDLRWRPLWLFLSGLSLGFAMFSSTVSSLYLPYYAAVYFWVGYSKNLDNFGGYLRTLIGSGLLVFSGAAIIFIYVNLPDIFLNVKNFAEYVHISGAFNHFYYTQPFVQQWLAHINVGEVRGGWVWIFKYLLLIMPVLFPLYLSAVIYLCWRTVRETSWLARFKIGGVILLSVSSPIMAEVAKVAQYGANYFPAIIGTIILIGYAFADSLKRINQKDARVRAKLRQVFVIFLIAHFSVNFYLFVTDVYIPRMATTFLSEKIKSLGLDRLATYRVHFHRNHFISCLDPKVREKIRWVGIKSLGQLEQGGYVIVPPATGDSLYVAASTTFNNFDKDIVLVQLIRKNLLKDCAVASFRTLANSRIWQQEEEILSYRNLILNQQFPQDQLGRVWIIDAKKVRDLNVKLMPNADELRLLRGDINNIGTAEKFYIFEGQRITIYQPTTVHSLLVQLWKRGDPDDALVASVYRIDPKEPIWLPVAKSFTSEPLAAAKVQSHFAQSIGVFNFDPPLELEKGVYYFAIYRTGKADDQNYYQINNKHFAVK